ncbi:hypothetical protein SAMN05444171_4082 [Bradyrhizobium lablabi]|uniref:Uncharacterized protein n=3 Tax=Nitrobacteraceae TaxID=41294 RepID=A0ABY0PJV0_9BRAD|nr:hypothetical protein SAMN05444163_3087 [Bradyrhizobium ottawaense]SED42960.1 hypothetical protein SAMN05444171_4082 [Bradyrhizobium lablabi]
MLEIRNQFGVIDLAVIDPDEVAKLTDPQQEKLSTLCTAVKRREAAQERLFAAVRAVNVATIEQTNALAAHQRANPPPSFMDLHAASVKAFNETK